MRKYLSFILILIAFYGCTEIEKIVKKESPHEQYERMLHETGLLETELGKAWKRASENALNDSLRVQLPYKEAAYFFDDKAVAFSYRFKGKRGEKISVNIIKDSSADYNIFIDLFKLTDKPEFQASAERSASVLEFESDENTDYIVRIQPELLKGGSFTLMITPSASLAFPVSDKDSRAVGSVWGDKRAGGARKHEGVDIFAPRRTPVTAVADGIISRTGTNRLGGKVVWLLNTDKSFYYAHLDSQLVSQGSYVSAGDTLGLVGNTGNAITTPPHLHFGIYAHGEGAVDPYPFIRNVFPLPDEVTANKGVIGGWGRVKAASAYLINSPGIKEDIIDKLKKHTSFVVYGASSSWYKVKLPDGTPGYIHSSAVESAEKALTIININSRDSLRVNLNNSFYSLPHEDNQAIPVHGQYKDMSLILYKDRMLLVRI